MFFGLYQVEDLTGLHGTLLIGMTFHASVLVGDETRETCQVLSNLNAVGGDFNLSIIFSAHSSLHHIANGLAQGGGLCG